MTSIQFYADLIYYVSKDKTKMYLENDARNSTITNNDSFYKQGTIIAMVPRKERAIVKSKQKVDGHVGLSNNPILLATKELV